MLCYYHLLAAIIKMFRQSKRRTAGRRNFDTSRKDLLVSKVAGSTKLYGTRVSFYDVPPINEITLEQFETWAIDRLKVLIEIESCVARSKSLKDMETVLRPLLNKYLPLSPSTTKNEEEIREERMKDHYSHYILRLVFCRSEELRKKFIKNEALLFKIRYNLLPPREQEEFINLNLDKLSWAYISSTEKELLFESLFAATSSAIRMAIDPSMLAFSNNEQLRNHIKVNESFIKLPFEKVPNLVSSRSVYLLKGFAYVPTALQLNLLAVEFQDSLSLNLTRTFQMLPRLEEDDRLLPLLNNLSHNFSSIQLHDFGGDNGGGSNSDITAQSITSPEIMKHFPLCAKHLTRNLVANSHLKYTGRQQLGLFLKGIGLSVDEALLFWSYQFTKGSLGMGLEKFNKEYKYNIRHTYGLEGARTNYRPWDCGTILNKPRPSKSEYHGCPYRDLSTDSLIIQLQEMGIVDQHEINGVIDDVTKNDYTIACTRVFELTHKKELGLRGDANLHINHPNLYFERSRQLEKAEKVEENNTNK